MHLHLTYCGDESSSLPTLFHSKNKELVVLVASPTLKHVTQIRKEVDARRETTISLLDYWLRSFENQTQVYKVKLWAKCYYLMGGPITKFSKDVRNSDTTL
jgi:hypothetical protein